MTPIFSSLLETDLYKFTMWQAFLHRYPANQAEYTFLCRNQSEFPLTDLLGEVNAQLDHLCGLSFSEEELSYLSSLRFIKTDFVDFLRSFRLPRSAIQAWADGQQLKIAAKGTQIQVMGFEIFVLALVNELYFRRFDAERAQAEGRRRLAEKLLPLKQGEVAARQHPFEFFDFGVRRRFSSAWQRQVVGSLKEEVPDYFKGTSNVLLAKELGLTPIGTMAHEYLQTFQATDTRLGLFQQRALEDWVQEYRGDLAIALTDVVGMDAFLRDFDLYFAKLFDGLRHDSGDPVEWGEKALAHYERLGVDAHTKRLVFSDGLTIPKALELHAHFGDRVQTGFGIGTNLTNDVGLTPLNVVMKLTGCNGQPTAKLSDSPGKTLCYDETFLSYLRQAFSHSDSTRASIRL